MLQVDVQLGLIRVGEVEASFVRALVAFNDKQLPNDEAPARQHSHRGDAGKEIRRLPGVWCHHVPPRQA